MEITKDEKIKAARHLLELYEKAKPPLKECLAFYLRKMHTDLVNAEDRVYRMQHLPAAPLPKGNGR